MTNRYDERQARRAYVARRQRTVLALACALLVVAFIIALMFYSHLFGLGRADTAAEQPNYGQTVPCAPKDKNGNPAKYVDVKTINVRVLNGTDHVGFAKAVASALQNREFPNPQTGNYAPVDSKGNEIDAQTSRTTIYFGKNTISEAYTLNEQFTDAVMVMDDRTDKLIDVVLGDSFDDLRDKKQVAATGSNINSFEGCVAADSMKNLPKAIAHTAVK